MRRFIIIDHNAAPGLIVHDTDDEKEARAMAQRYANANERRVLVVENTKERGYSPQILNIFSTVETTDGEGPPRGTPSK